MHRYQSLNLHTKSWLNNTRYLHSVLYVDYVLVARPTEGNANPQVLSTTRYNDIIWWISLKLHQKWPWIFVQIPFLLFMKMIYSIFDPLFLFELQLCSLSLFVLLGSYITVSCVRISRSLSLFLSRALSFSLSLSLIIYRAHISFAAAESWPSATSKPIYKYYVLECFFVG